MEDIYETAVERQAFCRSCSPGGRGWLTRLYKCMAVPPTLPLEGQKPIRAAELCVAAMRDAVGDAIDIMVDCHARQSPAMGLQFAKALEPYGLYFLEEPCWPECVDGLAMINRAVSTPIATGERVTNLAAFRDLFNARACEVCQVDITHCGGLSEARRVAALAEAHRISLAPHNPQGPVSTRRAWNSASASRATRSAKRFTPTCRGAGCRSGRIHGRAEGAHRSTEHKAGAGDHHQRSRGQETPVPTGTATASLLPGWQRRRLVDARALRGVLAIAHTPFTADDEIDRAALQRRSTGPSAWARMALGQEWSRRRLSSQPTNDYH